MFQITFLKSAAKEFSKLPKKIQLRFKDAFIILEANPRTEVLDIKKLKGVEDLFRLRVSDYRLLYKIEDQELMVLIVRVGHRRDIYQR
jgi:mRNA interferase RelE/StbE